MCLNIVDGLKKLNRCIWEGLLDHDRVEWARALNDIARSPTVKQTFLKEFDETWCLHHAICAKDGHKVR
jgi:hypothetical protein